MLPLVRQTRHLRRYRQIAQVLGHHGFGYILEQLGLTNLLSIPRRAVLRVPPPQRIGAAERLCQVLIDLGPTFVKIGQFLSTRADLLPPNLITELEKLQDTVPPFPSEEAIDVIESELGQSIHQLFKHFEREPLAAASLGQVHGAILHTGEHVAVKVQRPDIATLIETDLAVLADLAALAQERTLIGEQYDLNELAWEFSTTLRRELDYKREGRNAERFRRIFADSDYVVIPTVYWDYTSNRVLTTQRFYGVKINQVQELKEKGIDPVILSRNSTQVIFQEIFSGFFHADPHPGNFFALEGERIGAVDFGQVGIMDREMTRQVMFMVSGIIDRDPDKSLRALVGLGMIERQEIDSAVRRDMQLFIDSLSGQSLDAISAHVAGGELFAIVRRNRLTMPGPVATLLKAIIMMEGIGLRLDPNLNIFKVAKPYAQKALVEELSPKVMRARMWQQTRIVGETALELPEQFGNILRRLNKGELHVRTHEMELRRLSRSVVSAANYLALSIVLGSLIIGLGFIAVAIGIGGWGGPIPTVLMVMAALGALVATLFLGLALFRGSDI